MTAQRRSAGLAIFSLLLSAAAVAAPPDFDRDIRPILSEHCYACHGPDADSRKVDLRLDLEQGLRSAIDSDASGASLLLHRITSEDANDRMPPPDTGRALAATEIEMVRAWIASGAAWAPHWSLQPIGPRPSVLRPSIEGGDGINVIDDTIRVRLTAEGFPSAPPETPHRLLRRLHLDLTGLPPSPSMLDADLALLADNPHHYERVVDRLLESPAYGERMAWDWMDIARYSDTNGFQLDATRTMWPWRDWVVDAFNSNLPYDEFTVWQLAGDLIPNASETQRLATGFLRNHMINGEGGRIAEENRVEYVFDQLETVGTTWLGLTLNCCRCHDHKFDPVSHREYFAFFDFFNQTPVDGTGGNPQTPPVLVIRSDQERSELERVAAELERIRKVAVAAEANGLPVREIDPAARVAALAAFNTIPLDRTPEQIEAVIAALTEPEGNHATALRAIEPLQRSRRSIEARAPKVMIMADRPERRETRILDGGNYRKPGKAVTADVPASLPPLPDGAPPNRLTLARWLVDPGNPLMARVTVNREWRKFFGRGLVETVEDLGTQGERPSHPHLLDWLAWVFVEDRWDLKSLHRRIVTSATYRQSSDHRGELADADPENRLLGRGPRRRMPAWMIRDHALACSGLLVDTRGGPPVKPYQPAGIWSETTFGTIVYERDQNDDAHRRSLYTFWRRIVGPPVFFDNADRRNCAVRTTMTNTPLHALTTLNDTTFVEAARVMAARIMKDGGDQDADRVDFAFKLAASRIPTDAEREILLTRLDVLRKQYHQRPGAAAELLSVGDAAPAQNLDANDQAAFTGICTLILNLDEVLTR
jgi:hypothetical protein